MKIRINKFVAQATGLSRRASDTYIEKGEVLVNGGPVQTGYQVDNDDMVEFGGKVLQTSLETNLIMLNKPAGYVTSRAGQGSQTVYDLLPQKMHKLKPIGRLDKDSTGLILLTDDGLLANKLTHPRFAKIKKYSVTLNKDLKPEHVQAIFNRGVKLSDGISKFGLKRQGNNKTWEVTMSEGRNRQIRRTFEALSYKVVGLHRTNFGDYNLGDLKEGKFKEIEPI
jgi:23S rRNA pseudouridine2605 synthase